MVNREPEALLWGGSGGEGVGGRGGEDRPGAGGRIKPGVERCVWVGEVDLCGDVGRCGGGKVSV